MRAYQAEKPIIFQIVNLVLKKMFICGLAAFYYFEHQGVPVEQALWHNGAGLMALLCFSSFSEAVLQRGLAVLFSDEFNFAKQSWETGPKWFQRVVYPLTSAMLLIFYVAMFLSLPIFAYWEFGFTSLDTDYWTVRYIYQAIYLLARHAPYLAVDDMKTLIADGVLLPQIISIYMFNEISLELMVIIVLPVLIWLNRKFALQIMIFQKEPAVKTTFVRLLGQHDTIFLILVFSLMVAVTNLLDAVTFNWLYTLNLSYVVFILYVF